MRRKIKSVQTPKQMVLTWVRSKDLLHYWAFSSHFHLRLNNQLTKKKHKIMIQINLRRLMIKSRINKIKSKIWHPRQVVLHLWKQRVTFLISRKFQKKMRLNWMTSKSRLKKQMMINLQDLTSWNKVRLQQTMKMKRRIRKSKKHPHLNSLSCKVHHRTPQRRRRMTAKFYRMANLFPLVSLSCRIPVQM